MDRVVKCNIDQCRQHFMYTKEDTKCPFCHTEYIEMEEKKHVAKSKDNKVNIGDQKKSFKMWKSD